MGVPINYWAVIASAILAMVLGFLWYGPIFGKAWIKLMGFTTESMDDAKKKGMTKSYIIMIVTTLVMAFVFAHSLEFGIAYTNTTGVAAGLTAAFWNWLGFIATVLTGKVLWEGKSWKLWFLDSGYYLVSLCLMGIVLAVWR